MSSGYDVRYLECAVGPESCGPVCLESVITGAGYGPPAGAAMPIVAPHRGVGDDQLEAACVFAERRAATSRFVRVS
jgi:hypothetical protein